MTAKQLTIYGSPNCHRCAALVRRAVRKGIPHVYVDVTQDKTAKQHVKELGYTELPVGEVGDDHWSGARFDKVDELVTRMARAS